MTQLHSGDSDLLEDYKLKVTFAIDQVNRLQTQFQVMLTLESVAATALVLSNSGSLSPGAKWIAALELALSIVWLMLGIAGRERADDNRRCVEDAGNAWAQTSAALSDDYHPVGASQKHIRVAVAGPASLILCWLGFLMFLVAR
jgi:hypothetical protein